MSVVNKLVKAEVLKPPKFLENSVQYETIMGSMAYGVSDDNSDMDIYGFCIPKKDMLFPHLKGEIFGFGRQTKRFDQYQQHHLKYEKQEYDITIYSIVKYFQLAMENNPNIIDSLFTPSNCVTHSTKIGNMVRENKELFLHKGSYYQFKGYAFSQMHKMKSKEKPKGKRLESVEKYGYDVKYAYHLVRLLGEVEDILMNHTIDLQNNKEMLKAIRRGEWTLNQVEDYFNTKEKDLETLYVKSTLRNKPDEDALKDLLMNCLEEYFGNLDNVIVEPDRYKRTLERIQDEIQKVL